MPLKRAGNLGLMVYQFPPWFDYREANMDYVLFCKRLAAGLPLAVEFRHGSWLTPKRAPSLFDPSKRTASPISRPTSRSRARSLRALHPRGHHRLRLFQVPRQELRELAEKKHGDFPEVCVLLFRRRIEIIHAGHKRGRRASEADLRHVQQLPPGKRHLERQAPHGIAQDGGRGRPGPRAVKSAVRPGIKEAV